MPHIPQKWGRLSYAFTEVCILAIAQYFSICFFVSSFFCVFYLGPPSISRGPVASGEPPEATSPRPGGQAAPRPGGQAPVMGGWGGGTLRAA